ncbi:uncharacterized protein LOC122723887 [Manihot esculenta]|uniref:uncharacterized protein LOC122723887 n=1 Tax=Manihot esculenta TaxID=3983 RepID=UPI001CC71B2E|nr:uncharacterized protein LOC122723887 [Manihot esculenta]
MISSTTCGLPYWYYRHKLKKKYFDSKATYSLHLRNKPKDMDVKDWKYLVNLWTENAFQERRNKNKTNRCKRSMPPYTGTKRFARLRDHMPEKNSYIRAYGPRKNVTEYFSARPTKIELLRQLDTSRIEANERVQQIQKEASEQVNDVKKQMDEKLAEMNRIWEQKFKML